MTQPFIHAFADVQTSTIGPGSMIWQFVVVLSTARIGADCNIGPNCFVANDVFIGDRVTLTSHVHLSSGLHLGDDVSIGANVSFAGSRLLSAAGIEKQVATTVEDGVSIGAGATISPHIVLGRHAVVAPGAVVTRSVPANAVVEGNPAIIVGYVDAPHSKASGAPVPMAEGSHSTRVTGVTRYRLHLVPDIRGSLTVGEFGRSIPFAVKRYFIVFDVPSAETRGEHAHRECHQFLICVRGSCSVVADDGNNREEFQLDRPDVGLHLSPMVWGIQYNYSADAALLVFASHAYDSEDYIRSYSEFLARVKSK
ncbi:MAG: WxcM-like domain-containing protein [Pseudomonadota bacterium]